MLHDELMQGALDLAIRKNLEDLDTVLKWLQGAPTARERLRHADRAIELLEEIKANIEAAR